MIEENLLNQRIVAGAIDLILFFFVPLLVCLIAFSIEPSTGEWSLILCPVVFVAYSSIAISSPRQATVGKMLLGLQVVDTNGNRVSTENSIWRECTRIITISCPLLLIINIGLIMSENPRGIYDRFIGTKVIKVKP